MINQRKKIHSNKIVLKTCEWPIENLPGLNQEEILKLQTNGINTTLELVQQGKTPEAKILLAGKLQVHIQYIHKWVALSELASLPSVGIEFCGLLLHAGIISIAQLAEIPTHKLHQQVMRLQVATLQRRDLCPAVELVQQWSQQAKLIRNS
ncbi:MAG: DUF4332 domain-containing protein [Nostocales cyanobacterium]|nr:MAG: DUF4332 domain-containing protein [Nostocales cyanobacterium]TAF12535.1 MAG: DUF4332 domain-containing protein [Nostocales cyanobacterium]